MTAHPIPPHIIEAMIARLRKEGATQMLILPPPALALPGGPKGYMLFVDGRVEPTNDVDPEIIERHRNAPKAPLPGSKMENGVVENGMFTYTKDLTGGGAGKKEKEKEKGKGGKDGEVKGEK